MLFDFKCNQLKHFNKRACLFVLTLCGYDTRKQTSTPCRVRIILTYFQVERIQIFLGPKFTKVADSNPLLALDLNIMYDVIHTYPLL